MRIEKARPSMMAKLARYGWMAGLLAATMLGAASESQAASPDAALLPRIQAATFEVVIPKADNDPLTYEKPLPLDLLPYQERTDKYFSIGTAFSLGNNRYVTAGHVLRAAIGDLTGAPALRDASGKVYPIDQIEKYSLQQDFVVFSLGRQPNGAALDVDTKASANSVVFAVGNALGTGVVIRDGLYTSDTPEEEDGRWKWMRFSAAASPGNSGGPLLDQAGKVIGVVLMKSANENLNYALPIGEVLKAPDHLAVMDKRLPYQIDVLPDVTQQGTLTRQFALPLNFADFSRTYQGILNAYTEGQLKALLAGQRGQLFPQGSGASRLLHSEARLNPFPALVVRNSGGTWELGGRELDRQPLAANGYIVGGAAGRNILTHLRRPDDEPADAFYHDPKRVMDLLLTTGVMKRQVGAEKIKITSFGKPLQEQAFTDTWQRRWQAWVWALPYLNSEMIAFALPVPDGYVMVMRLGPAFSAHDHLLDLKTLVDFVDVGYSGTLAQWQTYLDEKDLLPALIRDTRIDIEYGKRFGYASDRFALSYTPQLQRISPDNLLSLGFGWTGGKPTWLVSDVRVALSAHLPDRINIQRHLAPTADLDDAYRSEWNQLLHREHPYEGKPYSRDDETRVASTVLPPSGITPNVLYSAFYGVQGTRPPDELEAKLELLQKQLTVKEH